MASSGRHGWDIWLDAHVALYEQLVDLARYDRGLSAQVIDATGVGTGLVSFLADQLGRGPRNVLVAPFLFKGKTTSDPGWAFIGLIDGGESRNTATTAPASRGSLGLSWRPARMRCCRDVDIDDRDRKTTSTGDTVDNRGALCAITIGNGGGDNDGNSATNVCDNTSIPLP